MTEEKLSSESLRQSFSGTENVDLPISRTSTSDCGRIIEMTDSEIEEALASGEAISYTIKGAGWMTLIIVNIRSGEVLHTQVIKRGK